MKSRYILFLTCILLVSCQRSAFEITKRHYRNGFYIHTSHVTAPDRERSTSGTAYTPMHDQGTDHKDNWEPEHEMSYEKIPVQNHAVKKRASQVLHTGPVMLHFRYALNRSDPRFVAHGGKKANGSSAGPWITVAFIVVVIIGLYIGLPGIRTALLIGIGVLLLLIIVFFLIALSQYTENH